MKCSSKTFKGKGTKCKFGGEDINNLLHRQKNNYAIRLKNIKDLNQEKGQ